ncbi:MAG: NAD(P)/FAD-dependent oxidoreductase [Chitinophagales bacterium]
MKEVDYLIVGQGLAGTWLSHYLLEAKKNILVIDNFQENSASNIASGVVNPITGRKLVKSWQVDDLFPFAKKAYQALEKRLNQQFWHDKKIVWHIQDNALLNDFMGRSATLGYEKYIGTIGRKTDLKGFQPSLAYAEIEQAAQVNTKKMIAYYRRFLQENNLLIAEEMNYDELDLEENGAVWRNIKAKKIIFCEGYKMLKNPFFNYLPLTPVKGETLVIEAKNLKLHEKMSKGKRFIVPWQKENQYWVGSSYIRKYENELPTENERNILIEDLENMINVPYKMLSHQAGIRPTNLHRKPFLGLHPKYKQIGIFNGLGTKGVSLSPFYAQHLVGFLEKQKTLQNEVNIDKYQQLCK